MPSSAPALPTCLVVGAMKCATTALHAYLDAHPEIGMAAQKEVNFFFGPETAPDAPEEEWWRHGHWHRGVEWYAGLFDARCPVRGESSPGYTDPAHPQVAGRVRALLPEVRLVYLVRDPVERAVSQWRHHVRDGTEPRALADAVLDPDSQYLDRSRYLARVRPFLDLFSREQVLVVVQERLLADRRRQLAGVYAHVGADPAYWDDRLLERVHVGGRTPGTRSDDQVTPGLRRAVWDLVGDDVDRLRELLGDDVPEWPDPR